MGNIFKRNDKKAQDQEAVSQPEGIELSEQELEQMSGGDSPSNYAKERAQRIHHIHHVHHVHAVHHKNRS